MKTYLEQFCLVSASDEESFILNFPYQLEMGCYTKDVYPFKIFPQKCLEKLEFEPITIFCGGNGSGKSTLLHLISQKLKIQHISPWNRTPYFEDYLRSCRYHGEVPPTSKLLTSDDVFDYLLDIRSINEGVNQYRNALFDEYAQASKSHYQMQTLDDYRELKRRNEAKRSTKSVYVTRRLPKELSAKSNGESAFSYFMNEIREDALYLLDEPENSLSPKLQIELAAFLEESARFYGCQLIISTHSPFLLSMRGAKIYDLDHVPVESKKWTDLENMRIYYDFFKKHQNQFE